MKQVILFLGGFGSGKTECAVNFALHKARTGDKTVLVDLDIVNPMFRSTFFEEELREAGVELQASESMRIAEGLPTVADTLRKVFYDDNRWVIFDVGGDQIGAVALGQFHRFFSSPQLKKQALFVVNTRRPATDTVDGICWLYEKVSRIGRMEIDGFVNNTNLSTESTAELLMEGDEILKRVSERTHKPVLFVSGSRSVLRDLEDRYADVYSGKPMPLEPKPRLPWMQ